MKEFVTAAAPELTGKKKANSQITFKHDGREVTFNRPSTSQLAMMATMRSGGEMSLEKLGMFMQLFLGLMTKDTREYFEPRLFDTNDPLSEVDAPGGIQDLFEELAKEWSGKDTKSRAGSPPPRRATGKRSTGNTRAGG